jgi:hypothetical protein
LHHYLIAIPLHLSYNKGAACHNEKTASMAKGIIDDVKAYGEKRLEDKIYEEGGYTALWKYRATKWYGTLPSCNCFA